MTAHGAAARPDILVSHPGNARVYDMVAALARAGFRVHFAAGYYFDPDGTEAGLLRLLPGTLRARVERTLRRRTHAEIDPAIVDRSPAGDVIARVPASAGFAGLGVGASNAWFDRRAARLVRRLRPRAVLAAETCALFAFRAAAEIGAKRILDQVIAFEGEGARLMREEIALHPELAGTVSVPSARTIARCRAEALAADRVLAPSGFVRDTLTAIGVEPGRIALVPYGVDTGRFVPSRRRPDGHFRVLFVGQIGARKGVHYLLEAFRLAALPDAELVLVGAVLGDGRWLERFRGLYRHVPFVPYHEVHTLFGDTDVYVFPSLHEGSSVSVFEAMAAGLPVVTTPNAGSVVRDGEEGFIVPIRDASALADRMRRLYNDPALRQRMGESARRTAERYGLDRYERNLAAVLRDLLGEASSGFLAKRRGTGP